MKTTGPAGRSALGETPWWWWTVAALVVAFWIAVGIVAWHFIAKWW